MDAVDDASVLPVGDGASTSGRLVAERGLARAARTRAAGTWADADDAELDRRFERAARVALAVPALVERSMRLRRLARRFVPASLHPALRRAGVYVDGAVALVTAAFASPPGPGEEGRR